MFKNRLVLLLAFVVAISLSLPAAPQQPTPDQKKEDLKKQEPEKEKEPRPNEEERRREEERKKEQPPEKKDQPQPSPEKKDEPQPEKKEGDKTAPEPAISDAKAKEKKEEKWDVNNPGGPATEAKIDVEEGTWMSVDVSPDGKEIVFDMLGDLYVMPIGGGTARALTTGVAWDMQPRYSPDGRHIAFTSDRGAGDNIWIMNRDGSKPQQVTKETFRLLNQPAWTPDGQFIVARKHFTSRRSLGAGEMWLYHRSGGEGLQLTKKRTEQKDTGEPAFSPDGRYLYYSDDITPGPIFEYNKDPNTEIFVIQRLDRHTGETERFVTGPGGSIRPTPSRDGKKLAFIRRVRFNTVLHVKDLTTGEETPLYDKLDRDMQETWSVHGVYPNIAWTPDNNAIIFWAGGKLHRIDANTRQVANIPFRVSTTRRIAEALHFRNPVFEQQFPVRMLRWVEVSPKGDRVIYQALGHIYVRELPDGTPRRLTSQNEAFEYYPSFSRDGQSVVFTTFDDHKLGHVNVVSINGGAPRALTTTPGHYVEPAFTPDGARIVYRRVAGGGITTPRFSMETGLYWVPTAGGKSTLITKKGARPQFGQANDRVYYTTSEEDDKRALKSVEIDGSDERTHLTSAEATEYRISPDERWIAFTERFNAHIMPFPAAGKSYDVSPDMKSLPIAKVSRDAGEYLHWSGDSKRLYWALGPELFSRELREAFAFMDGAPEKLPEPAERGINIAWNAASDAPKGAVAFTNARIITMKGDEVIENGTIVVEGNKIAAVGRGGSVRIPAGARTIDAKGHTIMPGIVDAHWHGAQGEDEFTPRMNYFNYNSLAFGVTTIHDPSNDTSEIFSSSELQKAGMIVGPRIYSTGTILYGARAPFKAVIETLEDARAHLRRMKAVGAFSVKSYNQPRRDQRQKVIQAARELNMLVVPEGGSLFQHNMTMIADGHTGVEHSIPVARIYNDVMQFWTQSKTDYTPTLVVGYGGLWGENYWYQKTNVWENQRLLNFAPREVVDERSRRRPMAPEDEFNHISNAKIAAALYNKGVGVQIGAHGQREGLAAHWELWMFKQGGMTNLQALRAATLTGAEYLGMQTEIGSLEPGKLADLVVLTKNPLEDIRNSEAIRYTMINGRLFDAMTMNQVAPEQKQREKFFFERDGGAGGTVKSYSHSNH